MLNYNMRLLLLSYSILFMAFGDVLTDTDHHGHHHSDIIEFADCDECIKIDSTKKFILDFTSYKISAQKEYQLVFNASDTRESIPLRRYNTRAPPIS